MSRLTLLAVHAHPDDETIGMGGTMARYAAEGLRVLCVTGTYGENGEIVVPELDTPENHARLGEIRQGEIGRALARLGPVEHHWLGYRDSGMAGTPENDDARSFWQADLDEAVGRLVRIVRDARPHVITGYNDFGGYGHPDHIRAAQVAKAAFARAADPRAYPEQLAEGLRPWAPLKLYEQTIDISRREDPEILGLLRERGISTPWMPREDESDEERQGREAWLGRMAEARGPITTRVEVGAYAEAKLAAMREHVTQIAEGSWFVAFSADEMRRFQPTEDYTLRESRLPIRLPEDDLFAGLR
ncbi:MAG TPA: PIG-L family deacetylase [Candidatus Limnocylindrales bacterium]|nr:PIG-L family deacetylase [Candidatus Limnocylindrales bacterium]